MMFEDDNFLAWTPAENAAWFRRYGKSPQEMPWEEHQSALQEMRRDEWRRRDARRRRELIEEFQPVDLRVERLEEDADPDWLVKNVLVASVESIIAAFEKSGKTTIATEIAVCIAASEPVKFLNYFEVCEMSLPVVFLNYEGTESEVRDRIRRIENARGVRANRDRIHVIQGFPPLNDEDGLEKLGRALELAEGGVVIIDCLYAALAGSDFTRMSEIGGQLSDIRERCREWGVTPMYVHHFKGGKADGLGSLSGAGVKESISQWMLLRKLGRYDHDAGRQRLRLEIGGRAGHGGLYTLDVTEGRLSDPGGRRWETTVAPVTAKPAKGKAEEASDDGKLVKAVLNTIEAHPGITQRALRGKLKRSAGDIGKAVTHLVADTKVVETEVVVRGNHTIGYRTWDVGPTWDQSHDESHVEAGG